MHRYTDHIKFYRCSSNISAQLLFFTGQASKNPLQPMMTRNPKSNSRQADIRARTSAAVQRIRRQYERDLGRV